MLLSSGANELAVQKAKAEITRLIKEELIRLVSSSSDPVQTQEYEAPSHTESSFSLLPAKLIPAHQQEPIQGSVGQTTLLFLT